MIIEILMWIFIIYVAGVILSAMTIFRKAFTDVRGYAPGGFFASTHWPYTVPMFIIMWIILKFSEREVK